MQLQLLYIDHPTFSILNPTKENFYPSLKLQISFCTEGGKAWFWWPFHVLGGFRVFVFLPADVTKNTQITHYSKLPNIDQGFKRLNVLTYKRWYVDHKPGVARTITSWSGCGLTSSTRFDWYQCVGLCLWQNLNLGLYDFWKQSEAWKIHVL